MKVMSSNPVFVEGVNNKYFRFVGEDGEYRFGTPETPPLGFKGDYFHMTEEFQPGLWEVVEGKGVSLSLTAPDDTALAEVILTAKGNKILERTVEFLFYGFLIWLVGASIVWSIIDVKLL